MPSEKVAAIIVAAGDSRRMGDVDKMFAPLAGRPVLARVLDTFQACPKIDRIIVVMHEKNLEQFRRLAAQENWGKVADICAGGKRRQDSVAEGLKRVGEVVWVVIHDGARPLVTADLIERGLAVAEETGAAVAAVPVIDTIKEVRDGGIVRQTLPRENLRAVQTPQVFRHDVIKNTYKYSAGDVTDDAALVEKAGYKVKLYPGSYDNIKITTANDLLIAEALLKKHER
ncbi:MAG: 2-C-methyl-D-erythritol 4-phosphate cytidylyltransferase [Dehalococcoidales bacterium]|jgi:2-C-methyl-D-erythritol 4-phosphate cytidylyltransferase